MAAQLRLIVQTAQTLPLKLSAQCARNTLPQRGFADAWRPDKAQDRRFRLRVQLQHRQMFEDALLDFFQPVMVLVEHLPGAGNIQLVGRFLAPGEFQNQLQPGTDHLIIGGNRR
ncbi:hypothetical protein HRbin36_02393 [bacterium HR36]|nr:hypothetical protein HRbin36_02393 [bacterium HR36]